jgi:hypothetical protein
MVKSMEKLFTLLVEHPDLAAKVCVPCALWGLVERDDDEAVNSIASSVAQDLNAGAQQAA